MFDELGVHASTGRRVFCKMVQHVSAGSNNCQICVFLLIEGGMESTSKSDICYTCRESEVKCESSEEMRLGRAVLVSKR